MKITLMKSISRAVTALNQNVSDGKLGLWSVRICKKCIISVLFEMYHYILNCSV